MAHSSALDLLQDGRLGRRAVRWGPFAWHTGVGLSPPLLCSWHFQRGSGLASFFEKSLKDRFFVRKSPSFKIEMDCQLRTVQHNFSALR